jgi:SAM-dependent methyltransferase
MAKDEKFNFGGIHRYVRNYIRRMPALDGKVVVDIPCGDGRSTWEFLQKGANVRPFDLFPEFMALDGVSAEFADLADGLPLPDESVDYLLCQEGIEHLADQLGALEEFNRVLKKGGTLILTTPSYSHARARLATLALESDSWKRMPATEIDSVRLSTRGEPRFYFGHIFFIGVQKLQTLATLSGFRTKQRIWNDVGGSSVVIGLLLYPLIALLSVFTWMSYRRRNRHVPQAVRDATYRKRVAMALSPKTLFCKYTFWVFIKEHNKRDLIEKLRATTVERDEAGISPLSPEPAE